MNAAAKAIVCGWFSYTDGHATAGDLLARDVLCDWLDRLEIAHVTAVAPPFTGGTALDEIDADEFTHAFFVCGPFGRGPLEADFFLRFAKCRLVGLNLSLDYDPGGWRPFDLLIERDSLAATNPDMVFASSEPRAPVIGVCLVEPYPEGDAETANSALERLVVRHHCARVPIDTRLDFNDTGLRTKGEVEALVGRMDAVVTTRLHGLVLALKNGVPALAVDPVPGGGKVKRQCERIGWPNMLVVDELSDAALDDGLSYALGEDARALAAECVERANAGVESVRQRLERELTGAGELERNFERRQVEAELDSFRSQMQALRAARTPAWHRRLRTRLQRFRA